VRESYGRSREVMKRLLLLSVIAIGPAALAGCGAMDTSEEANSPSATTSPSGETAPPATATPLSRGTLGEVKAEHDGIKVESVAASADIVTVKVVIEPGGSTGWHHHPGVTLVSVASGTPTEYDAECHKTVLKAGEGFFEGTDKPHIVRNEGKVDAVLYPTFLIPTETSAEKLTIADPQPKNCDVK
jgi:quercetin dioxygenase-like cupin family protein